jgi:PAS domain S-box-containing protein
LVEAALLRVAGIRWSRDVVMPKGCVMCALSAEQIAGLGFEKVVQAAAVSIAVIDASGRVIHSNERARALMAELGYEMPVDLDRAIDIFHADGRRYEHDEWPAVRSLTSGEEIVEEFFYAVPGGGRLWIRCRSWPVRDVAGEIVAAALTMTDVTERRREEARLAYLAGLLDNSEDAIVAFDAEWFVTVWNAGAERMYGWTADEVLGRHTLEVARLEMSYEERAEVRRAVAERGRWRGEVVAYRKDGTRVYVELITVAVRGERGAITGYLGIHRDMTERRRVLDDLRESQLHMQTVLESMTDACVAMDHDWRYVYANDRALTRLAEWRGMPVTREDIIGKSVWDLFPDARGTETESRLRAAMGATEPLEFEMYFAPTDEWVEVHAHPSARGLSIYYRSITARRRAEEALHEAEQQRQEAQRRLNDAHDAERRIARELHDRALQDLTRALAATGDQATNRDDVNAILRQVAEQLRAAIYDLSLDERGERTLGDSLGDLVDVTRNIAPGCEVTLDIDDDLAARSFGRRQTEVLRILSEALTNARRHAEAEHIAVRVTGTETGLSVEVSDDGRGGAWPAGPGRGVSGMYEHAHLLGAELDIRTDDTGTTVRLQVALSPAAPVSGAAFAAREHRSQSDDNELLLLAARHRPGPARDRLVDAFLPDIEQLARAVSTASSTPPSQLIEQGVAGLLRALDRYDPTLDTPFWAYARWWVRQAMR